MSQRAPLADWRNAVRDSTELNATATSIAFVLSTYFTAEGLTGHDAAHPSPSKMTLARGAKLRTRFKKSDKPAKGSRAVDTAINRLEAAGFLVVTRRRGARGFGYMATIPHTGAGYGDAAESRSAHSTHSPARRRGINPAKRAGFDASSVRDDPASRRGIASAGTLREWMDNIGIHYAHDADVFAEESRSALGIDAERAECERLDLLQRARETAA
jgi:hypothetical protein